MKLSFRLLRTTLLLLLLLLIALDSYLTHIRATDWSDPIWLILYPINGDGSAAAGRYIEQLSGDDFRTIEHFMAEEAQRYGIDHERPVEVHLGPPVSERPPQPPVGGDRWEIILWSIHLRYWSLLHDDYQGPVDMRLYVNYFDSDTTEELDHSVGLQRGLVGIVNAFADRNYRGENHFVIAHEMLHLFGASDKYDRTDSFPHYPEGYAEPDRQPLHPQVWTEIMGGRLPIAQDQARMPRGLAETIVGNQSAAEINWLAD